MATLEHVVARTEVSSMDIITLLQVYLNGLLRVCRWWLFVFTARAVYLVGISVQRVVEN